MREKKFWSKATNSIPPKRPRMMAGKTTRRCREGIWGSEGAKRQCWKRKKKLGDDKGLTAVSEL